MFHFSYHSNDLNSHTVGSESLEDTVQEAEQCLLGHRCIEETIDLVDTLSGATVGNVYHPDHEGDLFLHIDPEYDSGAIQLS